MAMYSSSIYRWLPQEQWQKWICSDIEALLVLLAKQDVSILAVGEENYKSPSGVIYTNKPFDVDILLTQLPKIVIANLKKLDNGIMCVPHYVVILYKEFE